MKKFTAFYIYTEYVSMRAHFTYDPYDYFRYEGRTRLSEEKFNARKDRHQFEKLSKNRNAVEIILANLVANPNVYIRELNDPTADRIYMAWKKERSSSYFFSEQLKTLKPDFDANFKIRSGSHPYIIKQYLGRKISLDTLCILIDTADCIPYFDKKLADDIIWKDLRRKIVKYTPFIKYDKTAYKSLILNAFSCNIQK